MEKIKNLLSGNKDEENVQTTGTGQTAGTTTGHAGLSGEGSHLAGAKNTTPGAYPDDSGVPGNTTHQGGVTSGATGGQASHFDQSRDGGLGQTSGVTGSQNTTTGTGVGNASTTGPHDSNVANKLDPRVDAGAGTTGTGVGNTQNSGISSGNTTTGPHDSNTANKLDPRVDSRSGTTGTGLGNNQNSGISGNNTTGPHDLNVANKLDPRVDADAGVERSAHGGITNSGAGFPGTAHSSAHTGTGVGNDQNTSTNPSSQHHYGRDAAAVGAAGAVGEGVHHHHKQEGEGGHRLAHHSGPYSTGTENTLDPSANTQGSSRLDNAEHHSATQGGGHHLGRDAAIGAGGVGVAEHEHRKHEGVSGTSSSSTGPAPNTSGPHKKDWMNKLDPRVNAHETEASTTGHGSSKVGASNAAGQSAIGGHTANPEHHGVTTESVNPDGSKTSAANPGHSHHLGRDAAVAGGVGAAGYEAEKHHHHTDSGVAGVGANKSTTGQQSGIQADHPGHSLAHPRETHANTYNVGEQKEHHYGRDAAVAGGIGAAGYGAEQHHKHNKDMTAEENKERKEHKHELKEERKHHHGHHDGAAGNEHHYGRDAAIGAGAVGVGEHEHRKHDAAAADKPLPTAPGNHGIGTGAGTQNALAGDNQTHSGQLVGEHANQTQGVPLHQKPLGSDLGDKLHGVERNRGAGATGATGATGTADHHYGRDAAVGAGAVGLGEHEHRKHEGHHGQGNTSSGLPGSNQAEHHYGRDGAIGAGAVGVGEHEHHKHEGHHGQGNMSSGLTGSNQNEHHYGKDAAIGAGAVGVGEHEHHKHEGHHGHGNTSSGLTGSNQTQHHYGKDAAIGAGAVGVGEHEHHKHEGHHGHQQGQSLSTGTDKYGSAPQTGVIGDNQYRQTDTTTGQTHLPDQQQTGQGLHHAGGNIGDDRNRLHKEPPLSHPAAQQQQQHGLAGQGQSGVTDQSSAGSANPATNY